MRQVHTHTFRFNDHIPRRRKNSCSSFPLLFLPPSLPHSFDSIVYTREETKERRFSRLECPLRRRCFDIGGPGVAYFNQRQSNAITPGPMPLPEAPT